MTITLQKKYTENIPKLLSNTNGNLLSIKHITNQGSGILSEKSFSFTPDFLIRIHQRLFCGVYEHAGQIRHKNISNIQSLTPKSQNDTLNCTLEEMAVLQYLQSLPLHVRHAVFEDRKVPVELVGLREEQFVLQRQFKRRFPVSSSLLSFLVPVDGFKFAACSVLRH